MNICYLDLRCADERGYLLDMGIASAHDIDTAVKGAFGHPMGPFELLDMTGIDPNLIEEVIASIYEGTNGIQANDLLGRKIVMRDAAAFVADFLTSKVNTAKFFVSSVLPHVVGRLEAIKKNDTTFLQMEDKYFLD